MGRVPMRVDQSSRLPASLPSAPTSQAVKAARDMRRTSSAVRARMVGSRGSLPVLSLTKDSAWWRSVAASPVLWPREASIWLRLESFMGSGPGGEGETRMRPLGAGRVDGLSMIERVMRAATLPPMEWPARSQPEESWTGSRVRRVARTSSAMARMVWWGLSTASPKPGRSMAMERRPRAARRVASSVQVSALPPSQ